jgi:hypothetical protein
MLAHSRARATTEFTMTRGEAVGEQVAAPASVELFAEPGVGRPVTDRPAPVRLQVGRRFDDLGVGGLAA